MSVQTEIDRIISAVGAAYDAVEAKGGTAPQAETIAGLAAAIQAIPSGSAKEEQEKTVTITANGTVEITPDAGKTLSKATAIVNVPTSGGGDSALPSIIARSISGAYTNSDITEVGVYAFANCDALTSIVFPNVTAIEAYAFLNCKQLALVDFSRIQSTAGSSFNGDSKLRTIILRNSEVAPNTALYGFQKWLSITDLYVYVPSALLSSYKAASGWSKFADQIRAIEDYPNITGG